MYIKIKWLDIWCTINGKDVFWIQELYACKKYWQWDGAMQELLEKLPLSANNIKNVKFKTTRYTKMEYLNKKSALSQNKLNNYNMRTSLRPKKFQNGINLTYDLPQLTSSEGQLWSCLLQKIWWWKMVNFNGKHHTRNYKSHFVPPSPASDHLIKVTRT